jgi:hypothetical protein
VRPFGSDPGPNALRTEAAVNACLPLESCWTVVPDGPFPDTKAETPDTAKGRFYRQPASPYPDRTRLHWGAVSDGLRTRAHLCSRYLRAHTAGAGFSKRVPWFCPGPAPKGHGGRRGAGLILRTSTPMMLIGRPTVPSPAGWRSLTRPQVGEAEVAAGVERDT